MPSDTKLFSCFGAPERIRTADPKLRRLVLYPAELRAQMVHWMGLEPTPVARLAPETSAYTNSATSARRINILLRGQNVEGRYYFVAKPYQRTIIMFLKMRYIYAKT